MVIKMTAFVRKAIMAGLGASILLSSSKVVFADIYVWGDLNGINSSDDCALAPDAAAITFTMLQADGVPLANNSLPDIFTMAQTPTCGTITYDTETDTGTGDIVGFDFFSAGPAIASNLIIDRIPDALDQTGNGNFFLGNMLFSWNSNVGIPVSIVWDAQGILGEMDGSPTSFTLNADGSINTASAFSDTGGIPASDGTLTVFMTGGVLGLGPQPIATTHFNTANVVGVDGNGDPICFPGVDADYTNNAGGGCMNVVPSADIAQAIIVDTLDISTVNPTQPIGVGGNPMVDGPFQGFNANFDFDDMKLVSFTDTTVPIVTLNAHVSPPGTSVVDLIVNVDTYTEPGATCVDAAPLDAFSYTVAPPAGGPVDTSTIGTTVLTYTCVDASGNTNTATRTVNVKAPDAVITLLADTNGDISPVTQECAVAYVDAGATCVDPEDGDILGAANPLPNNLFSNDTTDVDANIGTPGTYSSIWTCRDNDLNTSNATRSVNVVDTTAPIVTLNGPNPENIDSSTTENPVLYVDQGAAATDACDPAFPITIPTATLGTVTMVVPDDGPDVITSSLQYTASDADSNTTTVIRTVNVTRSQPVINLIGGGVVLDLGEAYIEAGMDVVDSQDGAFPSVTATGPCGAMICTVDSSAVDINTSGTYSVTYDVVDSDGNNATQLVRTVQVGVFAIGSNFTMLNSEGAVFGGTNDVVFDWDQTLNTDESDTDFSKMSIASAAPHPFFGFVWTAHNIRVFGPGTYTFDTTCTVAQLEAGTTACNNPLQPGQTERFLTMTVGAGQVGAHILFDWNTSSDIDVVNVWDVDGVWDTHGAAPPINELWSGAAGAAPDPTTTWKLVSTDVNGDGVNGSPMVDGPFQGFYANFNAGPAGTAAPPEPYTGTALDTKLGDGLFASPMNPWILCLSLVSLIGLRRYSSKQ